MPSQPPTPATQYLGRPTRRIDGPLKVTGAAKYAAEYDAPGLLHGYVVSSSIAKGRVVSLDTAEALAFPGVVAVLSHQNRPDLAHSNSVYKDETAPPGEHFKAFQDDRIYFSAQPVALVVADSFEAARDASASVRVTYAEEPPAADFDALLGTAYVPPKKRSGIHPPPKPKGHFDAAYQASPVQVDGGYRVATEHNNPMEPHATTCVRHDDGTFTVYDKTQGSQNVHKYLVGAFGLKPTQVRVVNSYVGGGFGSGLRPQYQVLLAMMASVSLERPVRVVLTRDQMFSFTHRPETVQLVRLGAENDGKLNAIKHTAVASTSTFEDHQEVVVNWSTLLYHADNTELDYQLLQRNTYTPGDMRAPGAVIGEFAIESAMDELAEKLGMDPIALRLKNYTEKDENGGQRFTSKNLKGLLRPRGRGVRLGEAEPDAPRPPRRPRTGRLGHGDGRLGNQSHHDHGRTERRRRRPRHRRVGHQRHRHRHLHDHGPDRRRTARRAAGPRDREARRFHPAQGADRGRQLGRGLHLLGHPAGGREAQAAAAADRHPRRP